jgi:hypothetical protein
LGEENKSPIKPENIFPVLKRHFHFHFSSLPNLGEKDSKITKERRERLVYIRYMKEM